MKIPRSLPRSVVTSLFTTVLDFGVLTGSVELVHVNYVVATWMGTVVGSLSNFTINKHWAFRGSPLGAAPTSCSASCWCRRALRGYRRWASGC